MNLSEYERGYRAGRRDADRDWAAAVVYRYAKDSHETTERRALIVLLVMLLVGVVILCIGAWT